MMISKEILNNVGGFDVKYDPLYEEDVAICLRIKEFGHQVIHIEKSGFNHVVSAFTSGYKFPEFWEKHKKNKAYFIEKWSKKIDANIV